MVNPGFLPQISIPLFSCGIIIVWKGIKCNLILLQLFVIQKDDGRIHLAMNEQYDRHGFRIYYWNQPSIFIICYNNFILKWDTE